MTFPSCLPELRTNARKTNMEEEEEEEKKNINKQKGIKTHQCLQLSVCGSLHPPHCLPMQICHAASLHALCDRIAHSG